MVYIEVVVMTAALYAVLCDFRRIVCWTVAMLTYAIRRDHVRFRSLIALQMHRVLLFCVGTKE